MKPFIKLILFTIFLWTSKSIAQTISIVSPANNSAFIAGSSVSLNVAFYNLQDVVTKISLYDNGVKFYEDSIAPFDYTKRDIEPGKYFITAKGFLRKGDSIVSDTVHVTIIGCTGSGSIFAEGYSNIPGSEVADLTNSPNFPNNPDVVASLDKFEYGVGYGDSYGARLRGYICAPITGYYTFYIAGDDQDGLWLSADENPGNKVLIAYNESHVNSRAWFTFPTQKSAPIKLVKGVRYYIETLHKQVIGPNYLSVAWQIPGGAFEGPIPGNRLSPYLSSLPGIVMVSDFMEVMKNRSTQSDTSKGNNLEINVHPNPSSDYFTILKKFSSNAEVDLIVTDEWGRVVEKAINISSKNLITFGHSLSSGIYFVQIKQRNKKQTLKVVKQ